MKYNKTRAKEIFKELKGYKLKDVVEDSKDLMLVFEKDDLIGLTIKDNHLEFTILNKNKNRINFQ